MMMETLIGLDAEKEDWDSFDTMFRLDVWAMNTKSIKSSALLHPEHVRQLLSSDALQLDSRSHNYSSHWTLALKGVPPEQAKRHSVNWVETMNELVDLGFIPSDTKRALWVAHVMQDAVSLPLLDWLINYGVFDGMELTRGKKKFIGETTAKGFTLSLAGDGPEELKLLEKMVRIGLAGGSERCVNPTDYAIAGLWNCASRLVDLGFTPGPVYLPHFWTTLEPIPAILSSFSPRGSEDKLKKGAQSEAVAMSEALSMLAVLERFEALGAVLDLECQGKERFNPFFALMGGGVFSNNRAPSMAMLNLLGAKLLAMGADPSAGGLVLDRCIEMELNNRYWGCHSDSEKVWSWALSTGLDVSLYPEKVLCRVSDYSKEAEACEVVDKLVMLGVKPSRVDRLSFDSPIRVALLRDKLNLAWKLIDLGVPLDFITEDGETALHIMATRASQRNCETLKRMLVLPHMLKLIEAKSKEPAHEGERALHLACSVLSYQSMSLLLAAGADVNARDDKGWTPLRHLLRKFGAGAQRKIEPCLRLLLSYKADPSLADNKGRTPAQAVAGKAPLVAIERLLSLRPEDIASTTAPALAAKKALNLRGGQGRSVVEKSELGAVLSVELQAEKSEPPVGSQRKIRL